MGKFKRVQSSGLLPAARTIRGWRTVIALALTSTAFAVAVAVADVVTVNDVVTGGDSTRQVGQTGTVRFVMTNTNGDGGTNGCNTAGGNPVTFNVTSSQPSKVALSASTIEFQGCDLANAQTVQYTALGEGSSVISASYLSGGKTGTQTASAYNTNDTMTVTVTPPPDSTPPVITPNVQGTLGDNDWYTSNVTVSFNVSDPDSAITSQSAGCAGGSVTSDTSGVTFTCTATSAGGSDTKSVTIKRDAGKPVISRDVAADSCSSPGINGWCKGTQTAGFSASDPTSGLVGQSSPYKFTQSTTTNGGAVQISSGTIKDNAGNEADAIDAGPFKIDSVAPVIGGSASPAANGDGWNNTNVTVSFTCSDTAGSGVSGTCGPNATLTNEGRNQSVTGNVADDAGNSATTTVSGINIDKGKPSAPTATPDKSKAYTDGDGTDWFKDSVSISYSNSTDLDLTDPRDVLDKSGSGVKSYSANDSLSPTSPTGPFTLNYSGTATDRADNVSNATTGTVKVDAFNPSLQVTGCPTGPVAVGSSQSLTVTASDGQSGLKSPDPSGTISLDTNTIGQKSKTVEAEDNVGHKVSQTCTYDVVFDFSGFYQPVDMNGVFNKAKAGSAIPVKFSLDGAPRPGSNTDGLAGATSAFDTTLNPNPVAALVGCPTSTALVDVIEEVAADSNSGLKYDAAADQWVYVWKTTTVLANSCRELKVKLADGTTKTAKFQFTK